MAVWSVTSVLKTLDSNEKFIIPLKNRNWQREQQERGIMDEHVCISRLPNHLPCPVPRDPQKLSVL